MSAINDYQEGPYRNSRYFYFNCHGYRCCLEIPEVDGLYKLHNQMSVISVRIGEKWEAYNGDEDFELKEALWPDKFVHPSPELLTLLQNRVELILSRRGMLFPT